MPSSPKYDHETIRRYVLGGLTAKQIAARLGCSSAVVWSVMRAMAKAKVTSECALVNEQRYNA